MTVQCVGSLRCYRICKHHGNLYKCVESLHCFSIEHNNSPMCGKSTLLENLPNIMTVLCVENLHCYRICRTQWQSNVCRVYATEFAEHNSSPMSGKSTLLQNLLNTITVRWVESLYAAIDFANTMAIQCVESLHYFSIEHNNSPVCGKSTLLENLPNTMTGRSMCGKSTLLKNLLNSITVRCVESLRCYRNCKHSDSPMCGKSTLLQNLLNIMTLQCVESVHCYRICKHSDNPMCGKFTLL